MFIDPVIVSCLVENFLGNESFVVSVLCISCLPNTREYVG